jgi:hypothetical protein
MKDIITIGRHVAQLCIIRHDIELRRSAGSHGAPKGNHGTKISKNETRAMAGKEIVLSRTEDLIENSSNGGGKSQAGIAEESWSNRKLVFKSKKGVHADGYGRSEQEEKERKTG